MSLTRSVTSLASELGANLPPTHFTFFLFSGNSDYYDYHGKEWGARRDGGSWVGSSWRPAREKQVPFSLFPVTEMTSQSPEEQFQSQQQVQQEVISALTPGRLHVCHPGKVENFALARCLSDFCWPLSQLQNQGTQRRSPQNLGLWVSTAMGLKVGVK